MPKIPMHVISEEQVGQRELRVGNGPGSLAYKGANAGSTFLCGGCRAIIVKSADADAWITYEQRGEEEFEPIARVRESCGDAEHAVPTTRSERIPSSRARGSTTPPGSADRRPDDAGLGIGEPKGELARDQPDLVRTGLELLMTNAAPAHWWSRVI